jgi:hypothetical protein
MSEQPKQQQAKGKGGKPASAASKKEEDKEEVVDASKVFDSLTRFLTMIIEDGR